MNRLACCSTFALAWGLIVAHGGLVLLALTVIVVGLLVS